nr:hypothetical protein Iba_chr13dCG10030 [Ipomoea batatas]
MAMIPSRFPKLLSGMSPVTDHNDQGITELVLAVRTFPALNCLLVKGVSSELIIPDPLRFPTTLMPESRSLQQASACMGINFRAGLRSPIDHHPCFPINSELQAESLKRGSFSRVGKRMIPEQTCMNCWRVLRQLQTGFPMASLAVCIYAFTGKCKCKNSISGKNL